MFTGIVEEMDTVRSLVRDGGSAVLSVACGFAGFRVERIDAVAPPSPAKETP